MISVGSIGHALPAIIPGLDPGIPTDSIRWGHPRIKSGDDGERTSPSAVTLADDGCAIGILVA
jgi:hypothetical protein